MIFRFDDICLNTDMATCNRISQFLMETFGNCTIIYAVSPICNILENGRVFPAIYSAMSDYKVFFAADRCGIPISLPVYAHLASHGLLHVDHRLLDRQAQEMSILTGCSLVSSDVFVPPFNKYNQDTIDICNTHGIKLIKFEDGWLSLEHNKFNDQYDNWYLHPWRWTLEKIHEVVL